MAQLLSEQRLYELGYVDIDAHQAEAFRKNWRPRTGSKFITPRTSGGLEVWNVDGYNTVNGGLRLVNYQNTLYKDFPVGAFSKLVAVNNPWKTATEWGSTLEELGYPKGDAERAIAGVAPNTILTASTVKEKLGNPWIDLDKATDMKEAWNIWRQNEVLGS